MSGSVNVGLAKVRCAAALAHLACAGLLLSAVGPRAFAQAPPIVPMTEASPSSQGLNAALLDAAVAQIRSGRYGDVNALLISCNQHLVLEKYFSPQYHGRDYLIGIKSATKSVASMLVGIAAGQGKLTGPQTRLGDLLPNYRDVISQDPRKRAITLDHLLSMTSGLAWLELPYGSPNNDVYKMAAKPDWMRYVLERPMAEPPRRFEYNSGGSVLLSGIVANATGQTVDVFSERTLFRPIGINKVVWSLGPNGVANTGWGLSLKRRDMMRLGILYLNDGRWEGRQIVPAQWVAESTRSHVKTAEIGAIAPGYEYGYQWWRFRDDDPTVQKLSQNDVFFAWGYGGQFVFIVPHLSLVVVATSDNFGAQYRLMFDFLRDHIFPATRI